MRVLVTGATGYIGGRLIPLLLRRGHRVRVLVRDRRRVVGRPWAEAVEVAVGDVSMADSLRGAVEGIDAAYYLVHSMYGGPDFARRDREAAWNFVRAVRFAEAIRHVVYLGGLLPTGSRVSQHLASRAEVGEILRSNLPATEFRAGPIIGSGSASFEMVRYLTERLPVMIAPIWIMNLVQPIAVRDVLSYLSETSDREPMGEVDIGADRLTFKQMMEVFAEVRGLRRVIVPVPVLAPRLTALWVGLVTPIPNSLAVPLVQGVVEPVLADTSRARQLFPDIVPIPYRESVRLALDRVEQEEVAARWSGSLDGAQVSVSCEASVRSGERHEARVTREYTDREGLMKEVRTLYVGAPPEEVFRVFSSLGGERGWLVWDWAWRLRGLMDRVMGGPGLRRGRRDSTRVLPGEAVDFWRVETVDPPRLLRLRAEMKVPGRAWLQWEARPAGTGTRLVQTALFAPLGFLGAAYWYSLYPVHRMIFSDLAWAIAMEASRRAPHRASTSPRESP